MSLLVLAVTLPVGCSSDPGESSCGQGYRGIEEIRVLVKGME